MAIFAGMQTITTLQAPTIQVNLPVTWHEVSAAQYIALQEAEQQLLPVWNEMKNTKARHDVLNAACEYLLFSTDAFAELDLQAHKTEMETLQARFDDLSRQYNLLTIKRLSILCNLPQDTVSLMPFAEVERLWALCSSLYAQPLEPLPPHTEADGAWSFRAARPGAPANIKTCYYLRHLADYPACLHQVYHALLKQLRQLTAEADRQHTEAELELVALFAMPRPENPVYIIIGEKPEKIDFDSGKFNERLNAFWEAQKQALSQLPITLVKGIAAFFLPHWKSYFEGLSLTPITATGTAMF